jgi:DNA-binding transcriptional MocR family regulator
MFPIDPDSSTPLVVQITHGVTALVENQVLRTGMKMPSIRQFAHSHGVSLFTVAEAYDRLVAQGILVSRPKSGFYVRRRFLTRGEDPFSSPGSFNFDSAWYLRSIFENHRTQMRPGCGWLPPDWLFEDGVHRAMRRLTREAVHGSGYGDPKGLRALRSVISELMVDREIACDPDQILLTQGSSQALDLIARRLIRPGDTVMVDDPGYPNLMYILRFIGARLIGIPRTPQGYDLTAAEKLMIEQAPKLMITQPRLHSPTGSIAQPAQLYRLLQLAEQHEMLLVEHDIYADLDPDHRPTLASLDQISRVIYVGSFSKTVSPQLRAGYLAAPADLVEDLTLLKMIAGLTSSAIGESILHAAVTDVRWRRHMKQIRERLTREHERVANRLIGMGFEIFTEPKAGLFLWARHPAVPDAAQLSTQAAGEDIMLGPGHLFLTESAPTPWMRFNVTYCDDERIFSFLDRRVQGRAEDPG